MSGTTERKVPMEVLVLGMCRTGTQSLCAALELLGCPTVYHMKHVRPNGHAKEWVTALRAKFEGVGRPWGREEFDRLLGEYGGISDLPAVMFAPEFPAAYPSAKIILSMRDEDGWMASMQDTIVHFWKCHPHAPGDVDLRGPLSKYLWADDFAGNGRRCFREHNEVVRALGAVMEEERFLEFDVKEGWGPLCMFLGKEVPEVGFPREDEWKGYREQHKGCKGGG